MTQPIRLFVSDVDGTLVNSDKRLTPATVDAVRRLGEARVAVTLISARPKSGIMPLVETLGVSGPIAAFNGGLIFRADGSVDAHHVLDVDVARMALKLAQDEPVDTWVFAEDQWHATSDQGEHAARERVSANQEPVVCADFTSLMERVDKITFVSDDPPVLARLGERCRSAFGARATVVQSQTYYLDITALAANKGDGVVALAAAFDVPLDAVAAIGDQMNDLPMLEQAGLSVAMGNAPDAVRKAAGFGTRSNDADGVAYAIDTIILPRKGNGE